MLYPAITRILRRLASTRLTLLWMLLLAIGATLSYDNPADTSIWVLIVPMLLLAINLIAAIISNPRINRRGGLLLFHIGLLGIVLLAAVGRLTHMDGRVEIVEGTAFSNEALSDVHSGPLHGGALDEVRFVQGPYTVEYRSQMMRGLTHSYVAIPDGQGGWSEAVVGDDRPLVLEGYRFYTTFNKGFAPILSWLDENGQVIETGAIHMPSYPLFDFKQSNSWTPQGGEEIKFWLQLETGLTAAEAWVLDGRRATGTLVVNVNGNRTELLPGESVKMAGGALRYERLSTWMGYKLFYDPTLYWMFATAMVSVAGLGVHFWRKLATEPLALDGTDDSENNRLVKDSMTASRRTTSHSATMTNSAAAQRRLM